jgi:hypothetical protein
VPRSAAFRCPVVLQLARNCGRRRGRLSHCPLHARSLAILALGLWPRDSGQGFSIGLRYGVLALRAGAAGAISCRSALRDQVARSWSVIRPYLSIRHCFFFMISGEFTAGRGRRGTSLSVPGARMFTARSKDAGTERLWDWTIGQNTRSPTLTAFTTT